MGRTLHQRYRRIRSGDCQVARQSAGGIDRAVGADLGHQPTQASVKAAQARLKKTFAATMARAKRYDAQGNQAGCTRELTAAKRMYIL